MIYAPPCSGITNWTAENPGWEDGNQLAIDHGLHSLDWWKANHTAHASAGHFRAIDTFFEQYCEESYHLIATSVFWDALPDAIVLPPEDLHRSSIESRDKTMWSTAKGIRIFLHQLSVNFQVPLFTTFDEASEYILAL